MNKISKISLITLTTLSLFAIGQAPTFSAAHADSTQLQNNIKPTITTGNSGGSKVVSGKAAPGTKVLLTTGITEEGDRSATADANGDWTIWLYYALTSDSHPTVRYVNTPANIKPVITYGAVDGSKTVSGTAAPGATVDVYLPNGKQTLTADKNGKWDAYIEDGLGMGTVDVWAKLDGQDWQGGDKVNVVANPASVKPTITSEPKEGSKSVSGTATAGTAVEVWTNTLDKKNPIKLATVTADNNGKWTATFSDGLQVNHYVQAYTKHGDLWSYQVNVQAVNIKPVITYGAVEGSKTLSGTAASGATVDIYTNNGKKTVTADQNGKWTVNFDKGLSSQTINAWAQRNGNDWLKSDDIVVNVQPKITSRVVEGSKTLSGTAAPGATVDIYTNNGKYTVTTGQDGKWTANLTNGLVLGGNVFAWAQRNGNDSLKSDLLKVEKRVIPTITSEAKEGSKTVSGTAKAGTVVEVWTNTLDKKNPIKLATVTTDNNGNWTATFSNELQVNHYVQAYTMDGDVWSDMINVQAIPLTLLHRPYVTRGYLDDSVIEGTATPGSVVEIWEDSCGSYDVGKIGQFIIATTTADANGNWKTGLGDNVRPIRFGFKYAVKTTVNGITSVLPYVDPMSRPTKPTGPKDTIILDNFSFDNWDLVRP